MHDQVGHVAMHEQLSRRKVDNLIRGHSTIGTTDPQIGGRLLLGKVEKKLRILRPDARGPSLIVFQKLR